MITLHHLENSQSFRIVWLLEELNALYELKVYQRDPETSLATAEYKALHPAGTAPVITDGDVSLAETNAIVDYILDQHADNNLRPAVGSPERTNYLYWFHSTQGSFMPMLLMLFIFKRMTDMSPALIRPIIRKITGKASEVLPLPRVKKLLKHMDNHLADATYLSGETFSAADIVMGYNLVGIKNRMPFLNVENYPNISRYLGQISERPAYQEAVAKGGDVL